jgi:hypothetical protein
LRLPEEEDARAAVHAAPIPARHSVDFQKRPRPLRRGKGRAVSIVLLCAAPVAERLHQKRSRRTTVDDNHERTCARWTTSTPFVYARRCRVHFNVRTD